MLASLAQYHPHGVCYLWETDLLWTHAISDGLITLAYYSIPIGLVYFVRKRKDLPFDWMFVAFATFILACGTTHAMAVWTLWQPDYWASAGVKIVTAGASLATAALMVPLIPKALALPSPTELEEVNRELDAFAYSVSHDLQAPLRAMEGFAVALEEDYGPELDETGREYTERIAGAARRMSGMVDELLDYSRLVRAELRLTPVAVEPLVDDVIESVRPRVAESGAQIQVDVDDLRVRAHGSTLQRVLTNLVVNAVTYVEDGEAARVRIYTERPKKGRVRIVVEDRGIGIAPEYHDQVFDVFERLHSREEFPGTGIGLAEVRKGAERMGGSVGLESEPGRGSRFWVELPEGGGW